MDHSVVMDGPKTEDCCSRPNTSSLSGPRRLRWSSLLYQPLQLPRGAGAAPRRAAATARTCRRRHLGTLSIHSPPINSPPSPIRLPRSRGGRRRDPPRRSRHTAAGRAPKRWRRRRAEEAPGRKAGKHPNPSLSYTLEMRVRSSSTKM
jgi:hypothetical protein